MSLPVRRASFFRADFEKQHRMSGCSSAICCHFWTVNATATLPGPSAQTLAAALEGTERLVRTWVGLCDDFRFTRILQRVERGDPKAAEQLLPLVYAELRKLAATKMARERNRQ